MTHEQYDAIALFSGGLDSILASRLVMEQGKRVKCLHFVTPFFGKPRKVGYWSRIYGVDIESIDISEDFASLLVEGPAHGFGSVLNPCIDCKILMMRKAKALMQQHGAAMIISGEVLGQRPMSQRRDTLNIIRREADVRDVLLRPLCALCLEPSPVEEAGLVDRSLLLGLSGRGRKGQMELAARFKLKDIPSPAGGCMLTERENARRYFPLLEHMRPTAADFHLANVGRQFWNGPYWLCVGRNQADNESLTSLVQPQDLLFKADGFPGPLSLGRCAQAWTNEAVQLAASMALSYSPKAVAAGHAVKMLVHQGEESFDVEVLPSRETGFVERDWENVRSILHARRKPAQISAHEVLIQEERA